MRIVILGAGLSGLTVAWNLSRIGRKSEVFEKEREVGGLCRSHSVSGFTFDCSGHVLHFRDPQMCQLVQRLMGGRLRAFARSAWIRACGRYIPYPFQSHLNALPPRIMRECLDGLEKTAPREGGAADFHDWIMRTFGRGVARHFMVPYNSKFWRVHPRALSCDWIGRFVPRRSAAGYNATLWYPRTGGIHTLPRAMAAGMGKVRTGMEAQRVNLAKREVVFRCGRRERFETLVNTVPLPEFIGLCSGVPSEISAAARALRWNSVYTYNFGFSGEGADPGHWVYFPGREYVFFRVGFYHAISGSLVPRGRRALYVEVSYKPGSPSPAGRIDKPILSGLRRAGIVRGRVQAEASKDVDIGYAYPIYDRNYRPATALLKTFLRKHGIISCGRYGGWKYMSMEDVLREGCEVAERIGEMQ